MSIDGRPDGIAISNLKHELKVWEKSFADANGGRKATREEMKNDATIARKYREYDELRGRRAKARSTPQKSKGSEQEGRTTKPLKERSVNAISATPSKKELKRDQRVQPPELCTVEEEEPTPACIRFALGPTPQKDGEILGIFDALPIATPSKHGNGVTVDPTTIVGATPSKPFASSSDPQLSRTPQSSGKRFYLGAFAGTPLKRKREDELYTPSTAKRQFATPSFLRRSFPLARIEEDSGERGLAAQPFKKRGLVRSLSTIIQGLKKQEEERMDEEWDVLNEIEAEERGEKVRPAAPKVLVEDSQAVEMPLGPDQGVESNNDTTEDDQGALDANGKPRKVWKKKGLKRQTKRVKMRPVTHKPTKETDAGHSDSVSESEAVGETQHRTTARRHSQRQPFGKEGQASEHEDEGSAYDDDGQMPVNESDKQISKKQKKTKSNQHKSNTPNDDDEGRKTKKPSKVNALAHTNFRKLKIKNKNSKANGKGKRFGRR